VKNISVEHYDLVPTNEQILKTLYQQAYNGDQNFMKLWLQYVWSTKDGLKQDSEERMNMATLAELIFNPITREDKELSDIFAGNAINKPEQD